MGVFKSKYTGTQLEQMLESISLRQEILYEVPLEETNFGNITLNKNFNEYDAIEIFAATDDLHLIYNKFENPRNDLHINFSASLVGGSNYFTKSKVYVIKDNQLNVGESKNWSTGETVIMGGFWGTNNISTFTRGAQYIGIYKIVGYKRI